MGLNPYSNGILTDGDRQVMPPVVLVLILILMEYSQTIYQRVSYTFSRQSFHTVFPLPVRKLSRWKPFFRKCRGVEKRIPNKNGAFFKHLSGCQTLASSQDKTPSKLFPGFAKNPKREICKGLVMNTLLHRAEADTDAFSQM